MPLTGTERTKFFRNLKTYVYVYCEIDEDNRRLPVYIGKGKSDRCLAHLNNLNDLSTDKNRKIKYTTFIPNYLIHQHEYTKHRRLSFF